MTTKFKGAVVTRNPALEVVSQLIAARYSTSGRFNQFSFVFLYPQTVARLIQYMHTHELYAAFSSSKADINKWKKAYDEMYDTTDGLLRTFRKATSTGREYITLTPHNKGGKCCKQIAVRQHGERL